MKMKKRFLSILLSLVLMLGLLPGMSLTARADSDVTASFAPSDLTLTEGRYECNKNGLILSSSNPTLQLDYIGGSFTLTAPTGKILKSVQLTLTGMNQDWVRMDDNIGPTESGNVWSGINKNTVTFWGDIFPEYAPSATNVSVTYGDAPGSVTGITLPATATLTVGGDAVALTATISPSDATDKKVKWSTTGDVTLYSDSNCTQAVGTAATSTLTVYAKGTAAGPATVTATSNYDGSKTASCNVTVNKANAVAATVTANNRTYDGTEKPLVTVTGEATGGEMQYALGTATEATQPYTTSIPTATNAGTYYVWYKVIGDKNHNDTKPSCITVTIGKKADPDITPDPQPQPPATAPEKPASPKPANQKYKNKLRINAGLKFKQTGSRITGKWGKVTGANLYEVYGSYCNKKAKLIKTVKGHNKNKITIKKLNGKKLKLKKNYKFYVVAYKKVKGKKTKLAKSLIVHIVGRKNTTNTNVKSIKLKKKSYTLKKGRTAKIKPRLVLMDKKKKALSKKHGPRFRYASSNKAVATVTKNGKIKARKAGKCTVYVYAINGCTRKIRVNVR